MVCFVDTKKKAVTSCLRIDSLDEVKDRKSELLFIKDQVFLLTASYTRDPTSSSMTYLTIYRVDLASSRVDFVNIIDGYQLGLDYDLLISDFDVMKNGSIVIHDLSKYQLLTIEYTLANEVKLVGKPWIYGSQGVEIEVTDVNTILVATKTYVEEWSLAMKARVYRYELEKSDNEVTGLGVSAYGVVVQTSRNMLYVYQRIMSTANYILGTLPSQNNAFLVSPYSNVIYTFS